MRLQYFSWRREWPAAMTIAIALFAVYAATMPPGVVFEDAGMIAALCYNFQFLHPPGYPLYSISCAPFARLADAFSAFNPAQTSAIFSALAAAGACVLFYEIARRFAAHRMVALAAALTLGLGERFWSQAIIPEVYALNAFLTAATFAVVLRIARAPNRSLWLLLFLLAGAGLANHWPLYLSVAPSFALLCIGMRRFPDGKTAAAGAAVFVLGLSPYLYLPLRAHWAEAISLFDSPRDFASFFAYISREIYAASDEKQIRSGAQCLQSALWSLQLLAREYTLFGGMVALFGAMTFARRRPIVWTFALLYGAMSAPLLSGYICADSEKGEVVKAILGAYPLPAMLFVMIFIVAALNCLRGRAGVFAAAAIAAAAGAYNLETNDRRDDRFAEEYAAAVLHSLPQNAAFIIGDDWSYPLLYLRHAKGERQDVLLVGSTDEKIAQAGDRRLFAEDSASGEKFRDWGLAQEFLPDGAGESVAVPPQLIQFYARLPDHRERLESFSDSQKQWEKAALRRALAAAGRALTFIAAEKTLTKEAEDARRAVLQTPEGLFGRLNSLLRIGAPFSDIRNSAAALQKMHREFPAAWRANIWHIEGVMDRLSGQKHAAAEKWRASLSLDSSGGNPALIDLLHLLAENKEWRDYAKLRRQYAFVQNPALQKSDAGCAAANVCKK